MDKICIDAKLLGSNRYLLVDSNSVYWVDSIDNEAWFLSKHKNDDKKCLYTLMLLNRQNFTFQPEFKFVKAFQELNINAPLWSCALPSTIYQKFVQTVINDACEILKFSVKSKNCYLNYYLTQQKLLNNLRQAKVDFKRSPVPIEDIPNDFRPIDNDNLINVVKYDRNKSRTGRMIVESGPTILTLKKEIRNSIFVSKFPNGKIISIDFASLEARIMLYEAGMRCSEIDLYTYLSQLFFKNMQRNIVKQATLSLLYGQGKESLSKLLSIDGVELNELIYKIRSIFRIDNLLSKIKLQFEKHDTYIRNKYGRVVPIVDKSDHILINSYIQATGVDVVLLGFLNLTGQFPEIEPLFIIHDAMIVDVPQLYVDQIMSLSKIKIPGYIQKFIVKSEIL